MPLRTSEGDGKGTAKLTGWAAKGACVNARSRWRRMAIPPSLHSHGAGHSANPVCSWDSSSPPPNLTRPPHRDGLRRQVSATTGIPDLDSVSFCTFLPRYLSGLLGQANSFRPMLHPTCPPAMDVSPSSLRLLFPAPLCSEAWNLNFLHFPIYTLLVYFFFSSRQYVNREYCFLFHSAVAPVYMSISISGLRASFPLPESIHNHRHHVDGRGEICRDRGPTRGTPQIQRGPPSDSRRRS